MALPNKLVQTAVLGVTHYLPESEVLLPVLTHCRSDAERLLLAASFVQVEAQPHHLTEAVGFSPVSAYRHALVGGYAVRFLRVMFKGYYVECLPEWFATVQQQRKQISPEDLPTLLEYGTVYTDFQPMILPILGERGLWLAEQNPDWYWVKTASVTHSIRQREDVIIDLLQKRRKGVYDDHPALPMLLDLQQIYSDALGQALIKSLRRHLHSRTRRPDSVVRRNVKKFATFLPIALQKSLVNLLEGRLNHRNYWRNAVYEAQVILNFRHTMIEAISR